MRTLFYSLLTFFSLAVNSQSIDFGWAKKMGGDGPDAGYDIYVDAFKNVYTTGYFEGNGDFDPGAGSASLVSSGNRDVFISKLDSLGNYLWVKKIGGSGYDNGREIQVDNAGNVYVIGDFEGTVDFNPGAAIANLSSTGEEDVFVLKLDAAGNYVWAKKFGSTDSDLGFGLAIGSSGNIYIYGSYYSSIVLGTSSFTPVGFGDLFVAKLNSSGNVTWAGSIGGASSDFPADLEIDNSENMYITGYFSGSMDVNPSSSTFTLSSAGQTDVFVLKLNSAGAYQWGKKIGGTSTDAADAISVDGQGNVYVCGNFKGICDFDPGVVEYAEQSWGASDIFISKLNPLGDFVWAKCIGSSSDDYPRGIAIDAYSNVYVTGIFYSNTVDFNPAYNTYNNINNSSNTGTSDMFILKLDQFGDYRWAKTFGSTEYDGGTSIALDTQRNIYTTGNFSGTVDFDFTTNNFPLTSTGTLNKGDIIVHKIMACQHITNSTASYVSCNSFTLNNHEYKVSGNYIQNIINAVGCDSVIYFSLQVNDSSSHNIFQTACNSFTLNDQVYTSSGIYHQTIQNAAGCDSLINLFLTLNHNDITYNATACDSISINNQTYLSTGIYDQVLTNITGCDSTVHLNITINNSTFSSVSASACSTYTLNSATYSSSGIYHQITNNPVGCNHITTLDLTILNTETFIVESACSGYIYNGVTYTTSGSYGHYYTNAAGCDSIITLNLTINNTSSTHTASACDNYTINGQTYNQTGSYTQTFINAKGCDSTLNLQLTIYKQDTTVTQIGNLLKSNASNAIYLWIDCQNNLPVLGAISQSFTPQANGDYAVIVTKNNCSDTSACYSIFNLGIGNNETSEISVFPNPTNGEITISSSTFLIDARIRIISLAGQVVFEKNNLSGYAIPLNIYQLNNGVYYVELTQNASSFWTKLIKL